MDEPHEDLPAQAPLALLWQPITKLEIQRSLKAAKDLLHLAETACRRYCETPQGLHHRDLCRIH
ncbi:uncharacterized protein N7525_004670 [Penicillium rubens]|uniref:uncharacterized protein n=1 Tax=Penicillium rubens TaxID=1108849 RepID=UPI002A5A2A30|nr:uncharacterized protein N7525_004670 [Penicillium rubens]KAJ5839482.1 hypothetical protein N7525_004670 [Penicillium rubens]